MPDQRGSIEVIAGAIADSLAPLAALDIDTAQAVAREVGLTFPPGLIANATFASALDAVAKQAAHLPEQLRKLWAAADNGDAFTTIGEGAKLLALVGTTIQKIRILDSSFPGFAELLLDFLVIRYLESALPATTNVLTLLGVLDRRHIPGNAAAPPRIERRLRLDRLGPLLSDSKKYLRTLFQWGEPGFDGSQLFERLTDALADVPYPTTQSIDGGLPVLNSLLFDLSLLPPQGAGLLMEVHLPVASGLSLDIPLGAPGRKIQVSTTAAISAGTRIEIRPPDDIKVKPPMGAIQGLLQAQFTCVATAPQKELVLLSVAGSNRIAAQSISGGIGLNATWNNELSQAQAEPIISMAITGGKIVIDLSGSDGFVSKILSGIGVEGNFDLSGRWSPSRGLQLAGSCGIEIALPTHIDLGPVAIKCFYVAGKIAGTGNLNLEISSDLSLNVGPLVASVERIGFLANLSFPSNSAGNLGPLDLKFGFKPPNGVGLSLDAGAVKGGGYLFFDFEKEEYAGALELVFSGFLNLKAIGLITTKMPDGSKGFSLLIIITAEFATGLQLGFGFTLLAVGGLIGLNRTMRLQPLADGIRSGAINSILFPRDVIANAPRIISDLRTIFPPFEGKFLIGPMAKLGWGTPTLISLSLGIIIEIPGNIAILGILRLAIPEGDTSVIVLQINFLGAIEFDRKRVWFFAALFDSRILTITLTGELGVLAAFGDDANLVLAVGGFHPNFNPPPLPFPVPRRLCVSIIDTSFARIRLDGYFALTTNSLQFGAHADANFGMDDFGVEGHLGFDALIVFSPLHFTIAAHSSFSLKLFGHGVYGISVSFVLEGPTPWRVQGHGTFSILFFDIDVDFDFTWGDRIDTSLPPIAALPIVREALNNPQSWRTVLPSHSNPLVNLRKLSQAEEVLVLQPAGTVQIRQKAVPLNLNISQVGNQKINDVKRIKISSSSLTVRQQLKDLFAPAQYNALDDAARLSRPAYEIEDSGVELSSGKNLYSSPGFIKRSMRYELTIIDTRYLREQLKFQLLNIPGLFGHWLAGNAASKSVLSQASKKKVQPFPTTIKTKTEAFAVVFIKNNQAVDGGSTFASEGQARDFMRKKQSDNRGLNNLIQVVPAYEVSI